MIQRTQKRIQTGGLVCLFLFLLIPLSAQDRTILLENKGSEDLVFQFLPAAGVLLDGDLDGTLLKDLYLLNQDNLIQLPPGGWSLDLAKAEELIVVGQFLPQTGTGSASLVGVRIPAGETDKGVVLTESDIISQQLKLPVPTEGVQKISGFSIDGEIGEWSALPVWYRVNLSRGEPVVLGSQEGQVVRTAVSQDDEEPASMNDSFLTIKGLLGSLTLDMMIQGPEVGSYWLVLHEDRTRDREALYTLQIDLSDDQGRLWLWERSQSRPRLAGRWALSQPGPGKASALECRIFISQLPLSFSTAWRKGDSSIDLFSSQAGALERRFLATLRGHEILNLDEFAGLVSGGS